jgi:hypothetical protein
MNVRPSLFPNWRRVVMHGIEWLIASLPLVGLVAVLAEIMIRDPNAILEIALNSEAFARAKTTPAEPAERVAPVGLAHA